MPTLTTIRPNHKSLARSSTDRQFCQITGTPVDGQIILPNHWHARRQTDNSAKSLARPSTDRQFSQITGTLVDGQTILLNHWHARRRTDNSAESLARLSARSSTDRQFCQITGTLVDGQTILPNHWHALRRTDNSAKSLARSSTDRQFCQITGTLIDGQTILPNHKSLARIIFFVCASNSVKPKQTMHDHGDDEWRSTTGRRRQSNITPSNHRTQPYQPSADCSWSIRACRHCDLGSSGVVVIIITIPSS